MLPSATSLTNMSLVPLLAAAEYLALVLQYKRYGERSDYEKLYSISPLFICCPVMRRTVQIFQTSLLCN